MKYKSFLGLCLVILALLTTRCGEENASSSDSNNNSYSGPGSKWDVSLNSSALTFTITRAPDASSAVTMTINGSYESLTSGFLKLEVSTVDSTDDDAPEAGDQAYALEAPGYSFILKPLGGDQIISMVASGACPSSDMSANWVMVKKEGDASSTDNDFFGTFAFDVNTGTATLPKKYALQGLTDKGSNTDIPAGTCADGILSLDNAVMYLTTNGGAIVHTGSSDSGEFIFGLAKKELSSISNLDGSYAGLLFDGNSNSGSQVQPAAVTCSSGTCTGNIITDIEANTLSSDTVTVTLDGTPDALSNGLVTGTITSGSDSGTIVCMTDHAVLDGDKKMMSCVGQSPGDNTKMFNILMVSKS